MRMAQFSPKSQGLPFVSPLPENVGAPLVGAQERRRGQGNHKGCPYRSAGGVRVGVAGFLPPQERRVWGTGDRPVAPTGPG